MQKIDRKLLDLIVEARRLRGNPESRWQGYGQGSEVHRELPVEGDKEGQTQAHAQEVPTY